MKEISYGLDKKFEKLIRDGAPGGARRKPHGYVQYLTQAQKCLVKGDEGLVGPNEQNIELIRLCWMN